MDIGFDLTKEDYIAFNMYHLAHSPAHRRQKIQGFIWGIAILSCLWGLLVFRGGSPEANARVRWPLLLFIPIYALIYPRLLRRNVRRTIERMVDEGQSRALFGRRKVTMTPVEITAGGDLKMTTVRWQTVERIELTESYAYLYFSPVEAVILPRRAFSGEAEFAQWVEIARKYQADSKSARSPVSP